MSDTKKQLLQVAKQLLESKVPNAVGLAPGVRVVTNANAVARFPLPLTIGSAVVGAIGIIATLRGYKIVGAAMVASGTLGLAASAAAPELIGALNKSAFVGRGPE